MSDLSIDPPGWSPPAAPPTASGGVPEDRKRFDNRRVLAYVVDWVLIAASLFGLGLDDMGGPAIVFGSLGALSYFLICEALWGQTAGKRMLGLRVVGADGRPAGARQVALRTALRVVDAVCLIGVLVMVATGARRQRIGDLAAGTVVVAAVPDPGRARRSPWLLLAGGLWAALCVALALASVPSYATQMQTACREAQEATRAARYDSTLILAAEQRKLSALEEIEPPRDRAAAHREILGLERTALGSSRSIVDAASRGVEPDPAARAVLADYVGNAPAAYAAAGVTGC